MKVGFGIHGNGSDHEVVMVAEDLIPGNRGIESSGAVRLLVVDGGSSRVSAGTWMDNLAVNDIDIPPEFVVLGAVAGVAQRDAKVEWSLLVKGVHGLDGGIENVRGIGHDG